MPLHAYMAMSPFVLKNICTNRMMEILKQFSKLSNPFTPNMPYVVNSFERYYIVLQAYNT